MTLQRTTDRESLLERELARSESERARAEVHNERLRRDAQAKLRVETELRLELERTRAGQVDAQRSIQMALFEVNAMRKIWTHAQGQLEVERQQRFALFAELDVARVEIGRLADRTELETLRADRDSARTQLAVVGASRSWKITRPLRVASRLLRSARGLFG